MEILTYSVVIGNARCNLRCPFCVAVMTPHYKVSPLNVGNLKAGADLAVRGGATTLLLTGKGEPTLHPEMIADVLHALNSRFPIVELQTNGLRLGQMQEELAVWKRLGLRTVAVSCLHWDAEVNRRMRPVETDEMPDMQVLVNQIHDLGLSVRLSVIMVKGGIDKFPVMVEMIDWCRANNVEQLSFRPVSMPEDSEGKVAGWVENHLVSFRSLDDCLSTLRGSGKLLLRLPHGAEVFDVEGQNVCMTNCLTLDTSGRQIRQLIYCSDGHIRYDWRYRGAILF